MKTTPLLLFIPLLMTSGALAAGQDDFNVQTASSRMVKHEDGSRSYFEKTGDGKGMKKTTYNIRNVLVSVTLYKRGPFGELRSCLIFDGQKNELFFVRYGYDGNANLREEQMFDSRTKELREGEESSRRTGAYLFFFLKSSAKGSFSGAVGTACVSMSLVLLTSVMHTGLLRLPMAS